MNVKDKKSLFLLVALAAFLAGCRTVVVGSYWQPDFSSQQTAGAGATPLDLQDTLGVKTDEYAPVAEIVLGDEGRHRLRLDFWKIQGDGVAKVAAGLGIKFAGNTYPLNEDLGTNVDLESVGIFWEPALLKTDRLRLRLVLGVNLIQFCMGVRELSGVQSSEVVVPGDDGPLPGFDYVPVPLVGACVEVALTQWVKLYARAQMFDMEYLGISDEVEGTFSNAVAGLLITNNRRFSLLLGYRHFHADYSYEDDSGDSTLAGAVVSAGIIF